jgi:hypothetical protein
MQFSSVLLTLVAGICILDSTFAFPIPSAVSESQLSTGHYRLEKRGKANPARKESPAKKGILLLSNSTASNGFVEKAADLARKVGRMLLETVPGMPKSDSSETMIPGENGYMPWMTNEGNEVLADSFFLEHYDKSPTTLPLDIVDQLEKEGVDFLRVNLTKEISTLMENGSAEDYLEVQSLLKAYLPDNEFDFGSSKIIHSPNKKNIVADEPPSGSFQRVATKFESILNFWIPTEKVKGRPLAFVKSSTLSPKITKSYQHDSDLSYDKKNKYIFVPEMKGPNKKLGELGEMLVFRSSHVFHGSPILENPKHQGERDVMVFAFEVNRVKSFWSTMRNKVV